MAQHIPLSISYAQRSDIGMQRRFNEDTSVVHEMTLPNKRRVVIAAVADGMGGAQAGAEASHLAVGTAVQTLAARLQEIVPSSEGQWQEALCHALHTANNAVHARSHTRRQFNGMGTTLLLSALYERRVRIAHIGDCRAYMVRPAARKPHIIQLTADHTVVAELIGRGAISHADATTHPQRHQLARTLGQEPQIEPELTARNLRTGERLVLCSDGLPLHVADYEVARTISDAPTPQAACDRLVELANQRGGRDNVTVVIIAADRHQPLVSTQPPTRLEV
ncbi:MAG TPA: protein phosphatase 2C domain-containing protein [Herpetosiphonaceae bacterium]